MENRILDRHNYSTKTIENFEIISAYYVDIFYNHLYTEAKKLKVIGTVSSVTEGYKHTLNAFLKGLTNPKLYKKSISGLHHYFITIGFASISYAKCIDRITQDFVPMDYFNSLTFTQKIGVLRLVLNQSMKSFIRKIVDEYMSKIIDFHKDKDNVRLLQDEFIDCLILEREGFFQRFIATQTKTNNNETVNRLLAEKMQNEIKRLVKEKYDQKNKINILKRAYIQKKDNENKLNEIISELKNKISTLEIRNTVRHTQTPSQKFLTDSQQSRQNNYITNNKPQLHVNTNSNNIPINAEHLNKTQQMNAGLPKVIATTIEEDMNEESDDDKLQNSDSNFIEVNNNNISSILDGDADILQNLHNTDIFDNTMEEGTTLDDFS
jgi:hypothetical protein